MRLSLANLHELVVSPKPVGVFCFSDYNAQILELECLKLGLHIPEDIAIIGVDNNTLFCENVPVPLSSVALDFEYISYCGARVLADILDGRPPVEMTQLIQPTGIRTRRSTDILTDENPDMSRALKLIHQNLSRPYGAPQIAATLGFSRAKVDRLFASVLERSVGEEIVRQRVAKAQRLLSETDWPLESIAAETGFCHASYLVKAFKKATGSTPHVWRRHYRPRNERGETLFWLKMPRERLVPKGKDEKVLLFRFFWRGQMPDNRLRRYFVYFTMTRHRLSGASDDITVDVVPATRTDKDTPFLFKSAQKINALHACSRSITPMERRVSCKSPSRIASRMSRSIY